MDKNTVKQFALLVGTKVELISSAGWAQVKCPLAPWTHDSGKDSTASAAISVKPGGLSHFTCFACENHNLFELVRRLKHFKAQAPKYQLAEALKLALAEDDEDVVISIGDYDAPPLVEDDGNNDATFPENWLDSFPHAVKSPLAMTYLTGRGLSESTVKRLDLRFDLQRKAVCFPTRDRVGRLCGLRGRYIQPEEGQPPYHIYKNPQKHYNRRVWHGENRLDPDRTVLMVESVFDHAAVFPLYENTIAPLTVGMSPEKIRRVSDCFDVVTLFDKGKGGDKARELITKHLPDAVLLHLEPGGPHRTKPGESAKDPGEMTLEGLIALLSPHLTLESPK